MTPIRPERSRRARPTDVNASKARRHNAARLGGAFLLLASLAGASLAQAQSATASASASAAAPAKSDSLTWNGITLYGIVDVGFQYQTHGVPINDYFPAGSETIIQKNSRGSVTGVTPSNLSQSRIGLSGKEPIGGDWSGVFRLETFFNPQSGDISDALKSITQNNGRALTNQTTNVDSSVAGQLFSGAAYAGVSSPTYGTFTFGRHVTPLADGISKYDPMGAANAFALIGFSGTPAGGGATEDRRLDKSVKYNGKYGWARLGALYQFSGSTGSTDTAYQFTFGGDFAGASVDAYYAKKYNAVSVSALSAAQVESLTVIPPPAGSPPGTPGTPGPLANSGLTVSNTVSGTISDNETFGLMGQYAFDGWKLSAGYENITFQNPNNPYSSGQDIIGGYKLLLSTTLVNGVSASNLAYNKHKTLQVYWGGAKYAITPNLDFIGAYYGLKQNSYATGANAGCSSTKAGNCSGSEDAVGLVLDYHFSKRFDAYGGALWTEVKNGMASGYLNTSTTSTTVGVRYKF
jgi:predicted porin